MNDPSHFALVMALGPVGRFITGGRRSRDLWYGSRLLSELTRQATLSALAQYGMSAPKDTLVVPRLESLQPPNGWTTQPGPWRPRFFTDLEVNDTNRTSTFLEPWQGPVISNKAQLLLPVDQADTVRKIVEAAEHETRAFLIRQLEAVRRSSWFKTMGIDEEGFDRQIEAIRAGDFVEFYAAWTPVRADEQEEAFERAFHLLSARKAARVFPAATFSRPGKPKSSLDPGRDSILLEPDPARESKELAILRIRRLARGIAPDERLDAIGLLRRYAWFRDTAGNGGEVRLAVCPFPPLARVAADAWLEGAHASQRAPLEEIRAVLTALANKAKDLENPQEFRPLFLFSSPCRNPGDDAKAWSPSSPPFPFDPSLLFEGGVQALSREIEEAGLPCYGGARSPARERLRKTLEPKDAEATLDALTTLDHLARDKGPIQDLHRDLGFPTSYYALLTADGDGIGNLLKILGKDDLAHMRTLVEAMDGFAMGAWEVIRTHRGVAFYVGGDELAAYLPVDRVLQAVEALCQCFDDQINVAEQKGLPSWPDGRRPTLSAGVVIAHRKDDLRAARHQAEEALREAKRMRREAKRPKNLKSHLVVREEPAHGGSRHCGGPVEDLVQRMNDWCGLLLGRELFPADSLEARAIPLKGRDLLSRRELSMSLAHDLLELYERFSRKDDNSRGKRREAEDGAVNNTGLELARAMLHLKARRDDRPVPSSLSRHFELELISWNDVRRFAHELLLAARINEVAAQRRPSGHAHDAARNAARRRSA